MAAEVPVAAEKTKRLLLAGARHVAAAERVLAPVLRDWAGRWCLGAAGAEIPVTVAAGWPLAGEAAGLRAQARTARGDALLMAAEGAWRQAVFGAALPRVPDDATASRLATAAREGLWQVLFAALGAEWREVSPAALPAAAGGQVYLQATVNGAAFWICLDVPLLEPHAPAPRAADLPALAGRAAALGSAEVELQVQLPLLKVEMADFLGLKVGDIIRGDADAETGLTVRLGDRVLSLRAALGARDGRKAVRLEN